MRSTLISCLGLISVLGAASAVAAGPVVHEAIRGSLLSDGRVPYLRPAVSNQKTTYKSLAIGQALMQLGDLVRDGKISPDKTSALATKYLGLKPEQVMMVACHKYDLRAAKVLGLRTAFVARPLEFGPEGKVDALFEEEFDANARDFLHLADQLDC